MTLDILKQSTIKWSYTYKPPRSKVTYDVTNTCPIDTSLQMIYFLWLRGFVPHSIVENDSLLCKSLNAIRKRKYDQVRHELILEMSLKHKVHAYGNEEHWNCQGDIRDFRIFHTSLFRSNGPIYTTWGDCSKLGENCPFHNYYQFESRRRESRMNNPARSKLKLIFAIYPELANLTLQERIYFDFQMGPQPCKKRSPFKNATEAGEVPSIMEYLYCPEKGMRQAQTTASFSSCPWVMTFCGKFSKYSTLDEIPKTVLMPPETRYFLASVILYDGAHFKGLSLDVKNSQGIHISYDGMSGYEDEQRIKVIRLEDPIHTVIPPGYDIHELWYVKTIPSSFDTMTTSKLPLLPSRSCATMLSTNVKPRGIHNFKKTCYLNTLVQIIFWVVPIRKMLLEYKVVKKVFIKIPPVVMGEFKFDAATLHKGVGFLKKIMVNLKASMTKKDYILKTEMKKLIDCLGLPIDENQCVNEFWADLFHHYFEFIGFSDLYKIQITAFTREILEPNKTGTPREMKKMQSAPLLTIILPDLQK